MSLYLIFLSMAFLYSLLLLRWNSDGHVAITKAGFQQAMDRLEAYGKLRQLCMSKAGMMKMFRWLGLFDATEDTEWCNVNDKWVLGDIVPSLAKGLEGVGWDSCALAVGGDQISHYMQSFEIKSEASHQRSRNKIWENCQDAWNLFNEAFPSSKSFFGNLEGMVLEEQNTSFFDNTIAGAIEANLLVDIGDDNSMGKMVAGDVLAWKLQGGLMTDTRSSFVHAQHSLGRALHTFQDSFAPAHVRRNLTNMNIITFVYDYGKQNQDTAPGVASSDECPKPGDPGWPGHHQYDRIGHEYPGTSKLKNLAIQATADLIFCVLNNIHNAADSVHKDSLVFGKRLITDVFDMYLTMIPEPDWAGPDTPSSGGTATA